MDPMTRLREDWAPDRPLAVEEPPTNSGTIGVLVDFDNFSPPAHSFNESALRHKLLECIQSALRAHGGGAVVQIRLYGGWMEGGILSRRGSEIASLLPLVDPFPITHGGLITRGSLTLATSLIGDQRIFADTYRRRGMVPRLRLKDAPLPEGCAEDMALCPARILKQFTQSATRRCPSTSCTVTAERAFLAHEQKMVDTLLSCDLFEMLDDPACRGVTLVTSDTDFVPPLISATRRGVKTLQLLLTMANWSPENQALLRESGIEVMEMEDAQWT